MDVDRGKLVMRMILEIEISLDFRRSEEGR
jgi:hypothetical protein